MPNVGKDVPPRREAHVPCPVWAITNSLLRGQTLPVAGTPPVREDKLRLLQAQKSPRVGARKISPATLSGGEKYAMM